MNPRSLQPWLDQHVRLTMLAQSCNLWGIDGARSQLWIWESRGRGGQLPQVAAAQSLAQATVAPLQRLDGVVAPYATISCCSVHSNAAHARLDARAAGALLDVFAQIEMQDGTVDLYVDGATTQDFGYEVDAVGVLNGVGFGFSYSMFPGQRFTGQASAAWAAFLTLLESHLGQPGDSMLRW